MSVARRRWARHAWLLPVTGRMVEERGRRAEGGGGGAGSERAFYFGPEACRRRSQLCRRRRPLLRAGGAAWVARRTEKPGPPLLGLVVLWATIG